MKIYHKSKYFVYFLIFVLSISIGYAYLNTSLFINGTSIINANIWDIGFDNLNIRSGSVTAISQPNIDNQTTSTNFEIKLENQDDFYEFTLDVINKSDLDAKISSLVDCFGLTNEQANYFDYTVKYENNESIQINQSIKKGEYVRIKIKVKYKDNVDYSSITENNKTLNLGFRLNYDIDDGDGVIVDNNGRLIKINSGNGTNIGDEICIGKECFYVLSSTSEKLTLLAKYNLLVGNSVDSSLNITPLTEETGIQDSRAKGYNWDHENSNAIFPIIGTVSFSDTNYWNGNTTYGEEYPMYVYDSNSNIYPYIENYKNYLNNLGANIIDARVLNQSEIETLGCNGVDYSCVNAPKWVYETSYWTGTAYKKNYVYCVSTDTDCVGDPYNSKNYFGVRPVIELNISNTEIPTKLSLVSGGYTQVGSEVCLKEECFYIISSNNENITALSKFNLYVGNSVSSSKIITPLENPTGIQSSTAFAWNSSNYPHIGTIEFSNDTTKGTNYSSYEGSLVQKHVNNYANYLKRNGAVIKNARLITFDELVSLGCKAESNSCSNAPSFVYKTSYWSGTAIDDKNVWDVGVNKYFGKNLYSLNNDVGIRPVITIDRIYTEKIEFKIDSITYIAEKGMTWEEWINSNYNINEYAISSTFIKKSANSDYILQEKITGTQGETAIANVNINNKIINKDYMFSNLPSAY